jgi:ATP-dependent Zn protease
VDKIDEALLKRPSRFDRVFHIGLPALPERREYCRRMLTRLPLADRLADGFDLESLSDRVAQSTNGFSPAYLKELFVSAGLVRAQAGAEMLDEQFANAVLEQTSIMRKHLRNLKSQASGGEMVGDGMELIGIRRHR